MLRCVGAVAFSLPLVTSSAGAGGFDRFDQDVSLLFDPASAVVDVLGSFVSTSSRYDKVDNARQSVPLIDDFFAGSIRVKFTVSKFAACMHHAGQPFGTDIDHDDGWSHGDIVSKQRFRVSEIGFTCSLQMPLAEGGMRFIGGLTYDQIDFVQTARLSAPNSGLANPELSLGGRTPSWRAGLAYELPSAGLVASIVYYAPMAFDIDGE